ncbi:50S ribosome-binding GTPase [Microdochium nivale]|nr:50S ribosome-binding GTPase [Microdochium nivale]
MAGRVQRPALGQNVPLGTLYNARLDCFLPSSLHNHGTLVPSSVHSEALESQPHMKIVHEDSPKARCELLAMTSDMAASHLAGLLTPLGSSSYLSEPPKDPALPAGALLTTFATIQTRLQLGSPDHADWLDPGAFNGGDATHVVTSIQWGLQSIVAVGLRDTPAKGVLTEHNTSVSEALETLKQVLGCSNSVDRSILQACNSSFYSLYVFSDAFDDMDITVDNLEEAFDHLSLLSLQIKHEYGGKGLPIIYTLLPIDTVAFYLNIDGPTLPPTIAVPSKMVDRFFELYDYVLATLFRCYEHHRFGKKNRLFLGDRAFQWSDRSIDTLGKELAGFLAQFAETLKVVRAGQEDLQILSSLYEKFEEYSRTIPDFTEMQRCAAAKVDMLESFETRGVEYFGFNGREFSCADFRNCYVLIFNSSSTQDQAAWAENQRLFHDLLQRGDASDRHTFAVVDAEATGSSVDISHIVHIKEGKELSNDVLADVKFAESHALVSCFARSEIEPFDQLPIKRYQVNIPCQTCGTEESCDWLCGTCRGPLQFGVADEHLYCDCGKSPYRNYRFKCNGVHHGKEFTRFQPKALLKALRALSGTDDINILILGETGVGKSTFINAFLNYLTYDTLDEAKSADTLEAIIPCKFTTQIMDRSQPDKPIEEVKICVGDRDDEQDGSMGDSATQQTAVYPINVGNRTIRLIDTPGIGDTRGHSFDKKNMADILDTLKSYDELHGILLLVKSNNARLTVTFNFCVKELLIHLHRSATENMAFAFTNTRISNYTPGDTYGSLKALLAKHSDVGLSLKIPTTYCFDSESFRYLAAFKQGHPLANEDDFRRSWVHSRDESHRLVEYFSSRTPHQIRNTVSLHGARQAIADLIKPMAEISSLICSNIALMEDRQQDLASSHLTGTALRRKLQVMKRCLRTKTLGQPRTVCTDAACIGFEDDGTGQKRTIYRTHCHRTCSLKGISTDAVAYPGLIRCAAFLGKDSCSHCSHHWNVHMHVLYELEEYMKQVTDPEIERQLQKNANDVTIRETAVKQAERTIEEYRSEHKIVQEAAAQFAVFLRKHAMATHNDATLAYLDMLIRDEEAKIAAGGNSRQRQRLKDLEDDKARHIELMDILMALEKGALATEANSANLGVLDDERDVADLENKLYGLKHFGDVLRSVKNGISIAHETTNRERPHRVNKWASSRRSQHADSALLTRTYDTDFPPLAAAGEVSRTQPAQYEHGSQTSSAYAPKHKKANGRSFIDGFRDFVGGWQRMHESRW